MVCRWVRRAGRHVGLTVAQFRVGAGSVARAGLDLGCPSRTEQFPLCGVRPARPVWASAAVFVWCGGWWIRRAGRCEDPIMGRFWAGVGPAVGTSWGTVVRVSPDFWPGDVACLAQGFVVDRCVPGAVTAPARW